MSQEAPRAVDTEASELHAPSPYLTFTMGSWVLSHNHLFLPKPRGTCLTCPPLPAKGVKCSGPYRKGLHNIPSVFGHKAEKGPENSELMNLTWLWPWIHCMTLDNQNCFYPQFIHL